MGDEDLVWWSATRTRAAMLRREVSAREVMAAHLTQLAAINPLVNALVTVVDPDALLAQAGAADERLARGEDVGVLHGLPLAVKDTEPTAGLRTTWGSALFAEHVPTVDSPLVAAERAAGAIVVGKSNVPEFAAGSHTFNRVFGVTRNPYDLARSAGGSSGGAAAALASGLVPLADGSDLGGSLRNPASFCNVVGFRPSKGRVTSPPGRTAPGAVTHAVHGPMGRTVEDVALLLGVLAGEPTPALGGSLPGTRIAWCPGFGLPFEPDVRTALEHVPETLKALGYVVVEAEPDLTGADHAFQVLRARLLATELGPLYRVDPDALKATLRWNIERGLALEPAEVATAEAITAEVQGRVAEFMVATEVAALALPTVQVLPFPVETEYPTSVAGHAMLTYVDWMRSCSWLSVTGHPAISVPAGFSPEGLPVGLQLVGRPKGDLGLLQIAFAFQEETRVGDRRPPLSAGQRP